ncbi:hypothetical protein Bbelb_291170 [Branchiostoma belcheri]|nr:hypothetical protein Bbelb_291170 [Branchiostoma belcheri]
MATDASNYKWAAVIHLENGRTIHLADYWNESDRALHINEKETKALDLARKAGKPWLTARVFAQLSAYERSNVHNCCPASSHTHPNVVAAVIPSGKARPDLAKKGDTTALLYPSKEGPSSVPGATGLLRQDNNNNIQGLPPGAATALAQAAVERTTETSAPDIGQLTKIYEDLEIVVRRIHKSKPAAKPRVNVKIATQPEIKALFSRDLARRMQGWETSADTGDAGTMHGLMKVVFGPRVSKTAPLKTKDGEIITDKAKQLDRWVQHYAELYSEETPERPELEEVLQTYPEMTELDSMPEESELLEALSSLPSGKAPGQDGIPGEVLKQNKEVILPYLYKLLRQCWSDGEIPHEMRNAKIVTLYKNKGDRGDCNSFRGISLLSVAGKAIARIVRKRLQKLAERVLPESQCGFRAGRSTVDMIFTLRQLQEKCREQCMPLYVAFVDLTKAFDTVCRTALYKVLRSIGCPPKLLQLVISFHEDMEACIQFDGSTSAHFDIKKGVKQRCVLAPTLFSIYFAALLRFAFDGSHDGIYIRSRTDGSLFNLARLRAKTKTVESLLRDLLFADDAALVSHKEAGLQGHINNLAKACDLFSLTISVKKTEVMGQGTTVPPVIMLNGNTLKSVEKFTYLGSVMTTNLSLDQELNVRIGKAAAAYGKLTKRDVCRSTLKDFSIQEKTWEQLAVDRNRWDGHLQSFEGRKSCQRETKTEGKTIDRPTGWKEPERMQICHSHMHHDAQTAAKVRQLCVNMLPSYPACGFVIVTLHTLSLLSAKTLIDIPQQVLPSAYFVQDMIIQVELLLHYLQQDPRRTIKLKVLSDTRAMLQSRIAPVCKIGRIILGPCGTAEHAKIEPCAKRSTYLG